VLQPDREGGLADLVIALYNAFIDGSHDLLELAVEVNDVKIRLADFFLLCLEFIDVLLVLVLQDLLRDEFDEFFEAGEICL
jgi:hypothetical protein